MKGLKCPHCNKKAFSFWKKSGIGLFSSASCENCDKQVEIELCKSLIVDIPFLIILFMTAGSSWIIFGLLLIAYTVTLSILYLYWIELIPSNRKKKEPPKYDLNDFLKNLPNNSSRNS